MFTNQYQTVGAQACLHLHPCICIQVNRNNKCKDQTQIIQILNQIVTVSTMPHISMHQITIQTVKDCSQLVEHMIGDNIL